MAREDAESVHYHYRTKAEVPWDIQKYVDWTAKMKRLMADRQL